MKKRILILGILFCTISILGQSKIEWGEWQQMDCFKGIYYKVGVQKWLKGDYEWRIKFKSTYNKKVHFDYGWDLSGDNLEEGGKSHNRITIKPNSEISSLGTERYIQSNQQTWTVIVNNVCFGETSFSCGNSSTRDMCYADCDNGSPNIPTTCSNKMISKSGNNSSDNNNNNENKSSYTKQSEINESAGEIARFPGGIDAFRQKVIANFDTSDIIGDGKTKTEVSFFIDENGKIDQVKATGNNLQLNETAVKAVKSVKDIWIPATRNGKKIRYHLRFPFTVNLENEPAISTKPNQQNGTTIRYEGNAKIETTFQNGKIVQMKAFITKTGILIVDQFYDENEKPKEIITYYENGKKRSHAYFINGKISSYKENDGHGNFIEKPIPQ